MNPYSPWIRYLHEAEEYNMAFYFTEGEHPVYISQKDIRQIQMAKSSICSGCLALLEEAGLTLESIDYLVLAGAFGNYIDIDNALSIGLLPPVSREDYFDRKWSRSGGTVLFVGSILSCPG